MENFNWNDYINGKDFNYSFYLRCIDDDNIDTPIKAFKHYKNIGNSKYDNKILYLRDLNISRNDYDYFYNLDDFINVYYPNSTDIVKIYKMIISNPKIQYRYFCFRYLNYMRQYSIPPLFLDKDKEAVLIEFRPFPHLEFIIRNAIHKLGNSWSYTIIGGYDNKDLLTQICNNISNNIRLIIYPYNNINIDQYSLILSSCAFWNEFKGNKILLYQEDSCIFNNNIDEFLEYDYIGAPWPKYQDDNNNHVGNGGFSLRSKKIMLEISKCIDIMNTTYNSSTFSYMKNCGLNVPPEDVYFTKNMLDRNIGKLASYDIATKFSVESIYNENPFGGHNFWIGITSWKQHLYDNVVIQVNSPSDFMNRIDDYTHRGGWKYIVNSLIKNDLYNLMGYAKINFIDLLESYCWNGSKFIDNSKPIICMIHGTIQKNLESDIDWCQLQYMLNSIQYISISTMIINALTFTSYIKNYLIDNKYFDANIISDIKHPSNINILTKFNIEDYINNSTKYIIQLGKQQRYWDTIYKIDIRDHKKLWLPGNIKFCEKFKNKDTSVEIKYIHDYSEYDELISKNIILCHVIDANANNAIIECIIRNIPIIINRHPSVVEYLGSDYPLYFDIIDNISKLVNIKCISDAYEYLKNKDKNYLSIYNFTNHLYNKIYEANKNNKIVTNTAILDFKCNITGDNVSYKISDISLGREGIAYQGGNSRIRSIIYMLSHKLFGKSLCLNEFPNLKHMKALGMSDNHLLASKLSNIFDYMNTFYHTEPYLDIYNCSDYYDKSDFIISSDVFEHLSPYPGLDIAFQNLYKILKKDGFIIFTVPFIYSDETKEHYPNLYDYKIIMKDNKYIMYNTTKDGKSEIFDNLIFHGGPGSTLEMRLFCQKDLINRFNKAGFKKITFLDIDNINIRDHGIYWENKCSLTMLIEK